MLMQATISWHVYDITGSKLQLGMIGLVQFIPAFFGLSLIGGAVADSHDRRRLAIIAELIAAGAALSLMLATDGGAIHLGVIYAAVIVIAVASAFENPASQALLPSLVTKGAFPNSITVTTTVRQFGFVTGPALGGLLIALSGVGLAYGANAVLIGISVVCLFVLRPRAREGPRRTVSLAAIKEGVQFVFHRQVLLGAMTLDLFAVIFGGAVALLPVYARDILHVGAWGYGFLLASADIGALVMAVALMFVPQVQRPGPRAAVRRAGLRRVHRRLRLLALVLAVAAGLRPRWCVRPDQRRHAPDDRPARDAGRPPRARDLGQHALHRRVEPARPR